MMTVRSEITEKQVNSSPGSDSDEVLPRKQDGKKAQSVFRSYMRIFSFANQIDYVLESIALVAALGSGTALALVNLVFGMFVTLISDYASGASSPAKFRNDATKASLYFVYIGFARLILTYIYTSLTTVVAHRLVKRLRSTYVYSALSQEVAFFDAGAAGSVAMQATSNGSLILTGVGEKLGLTIQSLAAFFTAFILAFATQWKLTLITSSIVPALFLAMGIISTLEAALETQILRHQAQSSAFAEGILANVRTVHAFGIRSQLVARYSKTLAEALRLGEKKSALFGGLFSVEYFLLYAGCAIAFWQGIKMIAQGEIDDVGEVFTVLLSVIIGASSLTQMAPHLLSFTRAASAAGELFALIDRPSEINSFGPKGDKPARLEGFVDLEHVSFEYPSRPGIPVLQDFSLHIPAGKMTALCGASGSGKSTIIGLIERWYDPVSGSLKLDGKPIEQFNLNWLRKNVRLVQQEPVLFNSTVFENIANGLIGTAWEKESTEERMTRVEEAAKVAFAHDFICELPDGYNTRIGERGGLLSGGQKQRIAIARSIISQPTVLLLDEATSALDPHAEGIVQEALNNASINRTTIVIAHKMSTIRAADNIVVMSKGRIVEQGTHIELMAKEATYASLVRVQALAPSQNESKASDESASEASSEIVRKLTSYAAEEEAGFDRQRNRDDYNNHKALGLLKVLIFLIRDTRSLVWYYVALLFACLLGGATYPAQALLFANLIDVFQLSGARMVSRGNFFALMFFVLALGVAVVYFVMGWCTNVIAQTLSNKYRRQLLDRFLSQDIQFFDRAENTTGALTSRLDTYPQSVLELMGFNIALIGVAMINVIACSALALAYAWRLGLVIVLAGLPPLVLSGWIRIRLETKMDRDTSKRYSTSASIASEAVNAIRTVSSLAIESAILKKYTEELDYAVTKTVRSTCIMMVSFALTQSIEYFFLAVGFWYGCRLVSFGDVSMYQFFIAFMGVFFAGQSAAQLFSFSSSITKAKGAANYIIWMQNLQPTIRETEENRKRSPKDGARSIKMNSLQFSYPLRPKSRVLKGVSLEIQKGQFVAFVGGSGCGKSTMIAMLQRFYDPTRGCIKVDSENLTELNPKGYREHVALVQQEPTLYEGTIRENISLGIASGEVTDEAIKMACQAANIWDFVLSLPEGVGTQCGKAGSQLSGGQRQRIAIARALIRNPRVLLLDEATSALDTESERVVQQALSKAAAESDRITVAVAHRLSTVREADMICVFYGGEIVEVGTHTELLARGNLYRAMCVTQGLA